MRQMIRWNTSGEVMVIDRELGLASLALHYGEQHHPLADYELDHALETDSTEYVVMRDTVEEVE